MPPKAKKKAWKGEKRHGPAPARHIPWPEIFKHHISVIEGHTKMLEMVQKHTVPNTGNHTTISAMVKRSHEIMQQAKSSSRSFIPPPNQRESVPLGSSSLSMYPGYSPAHIEYGEASSAVGDAVGQLKAQGKSWELPSDGPEYQIGQAHGVKRKMLFRKDTKEAVVDDKAEEVAASAEEQPEAEDGANPFFVIDTNPTPVALGKRRAAGEIIDDRIKKKRKKTGKEIVIETEDISAEVEARLKAKEDKKRLKDEKKRRRSGNDEDEKGSKKPKKDKSRKREAEDVIEVNGAGEQTNKKRKKE